MRMTIEQSTQGGQSFTPMGLAMTGTYLMLTHTGTPDKSVAEAEDFQNFLAFTKGFLDAARERFKAEFARSAIEEAINIAYTIWIATYQPCTSTMAAHKGADAWRHISRRAKKDNSPISTAARLNPKMYVYEDYGKLYFG